MILKIEKQIKSILKDAIVNFIMGALMSTIMTAIIVGLIIGEYGIPTTLSENILGHSITAIMSGGISGFITTLINFKNFSKKNKQLCTLT